MPANASPQSPPKRMTRARAKAVEQTQKAPARSTKITTPAAKAATAARATKRKALADDDEEHAEALADRSPPPPQPRARTAAAASASNAKTNGLSSTRKNNTASSNTRAETAAAPVTKPTRARPNKNATDADKSDENAGSGKSAPPARSTRTRVASVNTNPPPAKSSVSKKKVTFKETEDDKENAIVVKLPKGRAASVSNPSIQNNQKQTGLKAKPVRRTAAKPTALKRGQGVQKSSETEEPVTEPLSPKKNVQVSVPPAEDHSDTATTPTRELNKSPRKIVPSSIQDTPVASAKERATSLAQPEDFATSLDELQCSTAIFTSPTKPKSPFTITSPAKRPRQSPFKGSMVESPRKAAASVGAVSSGDPDLTLTTSVMAQPPRRFPMTEPRKRVTFDESNNTDMAGCLLKSPAKRPLSPSKGSTLDSSMTAPATTSVLRVMTSSALQGSPRRLLFSPSKKITSFLKPMKSPEASAKVHKMTPEEQARMFEDELACGPSPFSPIKKHQSLESPAASRQRSKIPIKSPPASPAQSKSPLVCQDLPSLNLDEHPLPSIDSRMNSRRFIASPSKEAEEVWNAQPRAELEGEDYGSEDELQLADPTSRLASQKSAESSVQDIPAPSTPAPVSSQVVSRPELPESMTVLAERFGGWKGATPDSSILEQRKGEKSMFSPLHPIVDGLQDMPSSPDDSYFGGDMSQFENPITVHADEDEMMVDPEERHQQESFFRQSQMSDASQEYGDENAIPIDPDLLAAAKAPVATCTPARVFGGGRPQIIHTVSKVPLKPAADYDESPVNKPAKRAHSLSGELSSNAALEVEALRQIYPPATSSSIVASTSIAPRTSKFSEQLADEDGFAVQMNTLTPCRKTGTWSAAATPARTPRPDLNTRLLSGAVVFVDVHTTEGADASGIFVELLTQMGARCVKQWNWNSRASVGAEIWDGDLESSGGSKVGITHVVFKDGGKRTMERVREAKGLVLCVGVGWVLDCERENKWLDEVEYAIDTSTIPRGGHRRRKSMEPKALSNTTFSPLKPAHQEILSPTKEFLNLSSPASRRATIASPERSNRRISFADVPQPLESSAPATPAQHTSSTAMESLETPPYLSGYAESTFGSPTTPYFLHPEQLVQQTCPPKQSQQLFFPLSGRIEDEPDEGVRQRLLVARRKSLQWAPRVGSPLARAHSFQ